MNRVVCKNDNNIHQDEYLQAQVYAAQLAAKSKVEKAKIDELKERVSVITQMRNRERQARAWKKISYATKNFTPMGVVCLGVSQSFDLFYLILTPPYYTITPILFYLNFCHLVQPF